MVIHHPLDRPDLPRNLPQPLLQRLLLLRAVRMMVIVRHDFM